MKKDMRVDSNLFSKFDTNDAVEALRHCSYPLESTDDLDPLMDYIGDAKYVLIGEASHGTHEYYTWRMKITQRLIKEKNFSFIAVEGDWPDCSRVNRYVKHYPQSGNSSYEVLQAFNRWPTWMWGNWEMVAFIEWLKKFNLSLANNKKIGFYGLDVYSFRESLDAMMDYLKKYDMHAYNSAQKVIDCFESYGNDEGQSYARASAFIPEMCEQAVLNLLIEIRSKISNYNSDVENVFSTEQNAIIAVNAERYYRAMIQGGTKSWNIRDQHMASTIDRLMKFHGDKAKVIIWEHNTHIGDARATDMIGDGMVNVGQLLTEKYANEGVVAIGFGSYQGTVIAGKNWGDATRKITIPKAKVGSWEQLFHQAANGKDKLLLMNKIKDVSSLSTHIGHRAIGVVYNPIHEELGNYVPSIMPMRYDAFIFLDKTRALHPLHVESNSHQIPETYPFGF